MQLGSQASRGTPKVCAQRAQEGLGQGEPGPADKAGGLPWREGNAFRRQLLWEEGEQSQTPERGTAAGLTTFLYLNCCQGIDLQCGIGKEEARDLLGIQTAL